MRGLGPMAQAISRADAKTRVPCIDQPGMAIDQAASSSSLPQHRIVLAFPACILPRLSHSAGVNSRQTRTLAAVFTNPVPARIEWSAIESLLLAVGCEMIEGNGSRVRFVRKGVIASFHRPHPARHAKRYQVRDAREFLTKLGVVP